MLAAGTGSNGELTEADQWLAEIGLAKYRPLFRNKGKYYQRLLIRRYLDYREVYSALLALLDILSERW